jgi:hypothetical protein
MCFLVHPQAGCIMRSLLHIFVLWPSCFHVSIITRCIVPLVSLGEQWQDDGDSFSPSCHDDAFGALRLARGRKPCRSDILGSRGFGMMWGYGGISKAFVFIVPDMGSGTKAHNGKHLQHRNPRGGVTLCGSRCRSIT